MNPAKSFVKVFASTVVGGVLLVIAFGLVANPHGYWNLPISLPCNTVLNPNLEKYKLLKNFEGMETLILGSSTSELFLPKDVETLSGSKTFHGSVAGSQTLNRLVLLKHAIATQPKLKRVIYVADFFEWNDNIPTLFDPQVLNPSVLRQLVPDSLLKLKVFSFKNWVSTIFSFQVVEKSFKQMRQCLGTPPEPFYDGSGNTPSTRDVRSGLKNLEVVPESDDVRIDSRLADKILESQVEYRRGAFKNFDFSPRVALMYQEILRLAKRKNIELNIVLSPYHPQFLKAFKTDPVFQSGDFEKFYLQWRNQLKKMSLSGAKVWDFTQSQDYFPKSRAYWRDGVHYNQNGTAQLLKVIFRKQKNRQ